MIQEKKQFDPSQPYEVISDEPPKFDPSKPFDVIEQEVTVEPVMKTVPAPSAVFGYGRKVTTVDEAATEKAILEQKGVDVSGAPMKLRADVSAFTKQAPQDIARLADKYYGVEGTRVVEEPQTGRMVMQLPDGQNILYDSPDLELADVADIAGEAMEALAGIGGGIVGGIGTRTPKGAFVASAATEGAATSGRLYAGRNLGKNDYSNFEILSEGLKTAGIALVAGKTFEKAGDLMKSFFGNPVVKQLTRNIPDDDMARIFSEAKAYEQQIKDEFDVDLNLSFGEALKVAGYSDRHVDIIRKLERDLAKNFEIEGRVLRDIQEGLAETADIMEARLIPDVSADEFARLEIGEEVQGIVRNQINTYRNDLNVVAQDIISKANDDIGKMLKTQRGDAAQNIRQYMTDARRATNDAVRERYQTFWAESPIPEQTLGGVRDIAMKYERQYGKDFLKPLMEEDQRLVRSIMNETVDVVDGVTALKSFDIDTINRSLSMLKDAQRNTPLEKRPYNRRMLTEMVGELQRVRDEAVKQVRGEEGVAVLRSIDTTKREMHELLDQTMLGKISGSERDKQIVDLVFANPSTARDVKRLVDDEMFAGFNSVEPFKKGLMAKYREVVGRPDMTPQARVKAHNKFMFDYGEGMKEILSPKDFDNFSNARKALAMAEVAERQEATALKELEKTFDVKLANLDRPEDLMAMVTGSVSDVRKLKRILRNHPETMKRVADLRVKSLFYDTAQYVDGRYDIKPANFDKALRENAAELTELMGADWLASARKLNKILDLQEPPKGMSSGEFKDMLAQRGPEGLVEGVWRAGIGVLNRLGLVTTKVMTLSNKQARKATAKMLSDRDTMELAYRLWKKGGKARDYRKLFAQVGLPEIADNIVDENLPPMEE